MVPRWRKIIRLAVRIHRSDLKIEVHWITSLLAALESRREPRWRPPRPTAFSRHLRPGAPAGFGVSFPPSVCNRHNTGMRIVQFVAVDGPHAEIGGLRWQSAPPAGPLILSQRPEMVIANSPTHRRRWPFLQECNFGLSISQLVGWTGGFCNLRFPAARAAPQVNDLSVELIFRVATAGADHGRPGKLLLKYCH